MLKVQVTVDVYFDEELEEYVPVTEDLYLTHTLKTVSKWEERHKKPFLSADSSRTATEQLDYVRLMCVEGDFEKCVPHLSQENADAISEYINDQHTATTFLEVEKNSGPESWNHGTKKQPVITSELIYYWMFSNRIDISTENWHLNRLLTLIRIFSEKNQEEQRKADPKSQGNSMAQMAKINRERMKGGNRIPNKKLP